MALKLHNSASQQLTAQHSFLTHSECIIVFLAKHRRKCLPLSRAPLVFLVARSSSLLARLALLTRLARLMFYNIIWAIWAIGTTCPAYLFFFRRHYYMEMKLHSLSLPACINCTNAHPNVRFVRSVRSLPVFLLFLWHTQELARNWCCNGQQLGREKRERCANGNILLARELALDDGAWIEITCETKTRIEFWGERKKKVERKKHAVQDRLHA